MSIKKRLQKYSVTMYVSTVAIYDDFLFEKTRLIRSSVTRISPATEINSRFFNSYRGSTVNHKNSKARALEY